MIKQILLALLIFNFLKYDLKGQTIGLSVNKHMPTHFKSFKKHIQKVDNPYLVKKTDIKPLKIPLIFSAETLPFFCKIEYKMGLNKKLPVKFRLGEVQYVESLEHPKILTKL
jgi:hypothetical protein